MKKYNIDEQLHNKLGGRTITPSANAWERIAYNRKVQQQKKRRYMAYRIAAVVIVSLGLFGLFITNTATTPQQIQVVQGTSVKATTPQIVPQPIITPVVQRVATLPKVQQASAKQQITKQVVVDSITRQQAGIALQQQLELQKANEVAYSINQLAQKKGSVTEDEIDSMLVSAQRQIALESLKNKNLPTSDTALLKEAETAVEHSFREKTLNIFKHKFRTIKIALSDN